MERVNDRMRNVAARYAMLRYSEEVTADIKLQKCTPLRGSASVRGEGWQSRNHTVRTQNFTFSLGESSSEPPPLRGDF
jgi:hypothetical protein